MGNFGLALFFAYFLGSIPSGVWIGKLFYGKDIREFGSGNMGTTNTFRVLGILPGTVVLFMDAFKGFIPIMLTYSWLKIEPYSPLLVGIAALLGHTYPIFAQFKGGKAVATFLGVMLAYQPLLALIGIGVFVVCLLLTRMVSLSSMTTVTIGVFISLFLQDYYLFWCIVVVDLFIIYRHRQNIQRILNGNENKLVFPWEKDK